MNNLMQSGVWCSIKQGYYKPVVPYKTLDLSFCCDFMLYALSLISVLQYISDVTDK